MNRFIPLLALLTLSACSGYEEDTEPVGAVTQNEAEALDDAAEMIEQRRLPEGVVPPAEPEGFDGAPAGKMPSAAAPQETGGPEQMELPDE
ncbi:hypothetical protein N6L26_11755 [Qipengyuania sp. SS22]|uniref:hypothetical protein n=1 Tax=Qipengyuania sp. SS22 TaxID=2979461 RepID=UPI0021E52B3B|nr:hypothetical protein [Qipengyuania sp. SS22]UYH54703.1 hypothetical protein N6L26_11755 [Qipengyuania sp. SS22]